MKGINHEEDMINKLNEMKGVMARHSATNWDDQAQAPCAIHGKNAMCKLYDLGKSITAKARRRCRNGVLYENVYQGERGPKFSSIPLPKVVQNAPSPVDIITVMIAGTMCKDFSRLNQARRHEFGKQHPQFVCVHCVLRKHQVQWCTGSPSTMTVGHD